MTMAGNLRRKRELVDSPAERRISGVSLFNYNQASRIFGILNFSNKMALNFELKIRLSH